MTAVAFPVTAPEVSFPLTRNKKFRTISADFGDGYTQRTGDGLNTSLEVYPLTWEIITEAEKDILVDFFDSLEGYLATSYMMPWDDAAKNWIIKEYTLQKTNSSYYTVTATFERVYDI